MLIVLQESPLNSLARTRSRPYHQQNGLCCYCDLPMVEGSPHHNLFACTAEHVVARQDGGSDAETNIVAAHYYCNTKRHARKKPKSADAYRVFVKSRLAK